MKINGLCHAMECFSRATHLQALVDAKVINPREEATVKENVAKGLAKMLMAGFDLDALLIEAKKLTN